MEENLIDEEPIKDKFLLEKIIVTTTNIKIVVKFRTMKEV